jgi:hypothetical protein
MEWRKLAATEFRGRPIGLLGGDAEDEVAFKAWYAGLIRRYEAPYTLESQRGGPTPLELATVDELVTELTRRFGSAVFAGVMDLSKEREAYSTRFTGSTAACLGLLTILRRSIVHKHREDGGP